jgi:hypothetical protein
MMDLGDRRRNLGVVARQSGLADRRAVQAGRHGKLSSPSYVNHTWQARISGKNAEKGFRIFHSLVSVMVFIVSHPKPGP